MSRTSLFAVVLLSALAATPASAQDEFAAEVGYASVNLDPFTAGALYGFLGTVFETDTAMSYAAELVLAIGIVDDEFTVFGQNVDVGLDSLYGVSGKARFEASDELAFFGRALFAKVNVDASGFASPVAADDTGFGLSLGVEFRALNLSYIRFFGDLQDIEAIAFGVSFP